MSFEPRATSHESRSAQFPDYPFKSNYLPVNGHRMHYLDEGEHAAPPVVMVHGNPTWSFFFRKPVQALRGAYRCIVPDHIGMGLSEKPPAPAYGYGLSERIDDLETLLDQLDIRERITLLLHDWGGMIGMGYACRHPERIAALVILNTSAFPSPDGGVLPWQLRLARSIAGPLLVQGFNAFCRGALRNCVAGAPLDAGTRQAYLAPYSGWHERLAVLRFVQDIPMTPAASSYPLVRRIDRECAVFKQTPMLVCWGMKDFVFTGQFLQLWRDRFPAAEIHTFTDAGHFLLEDAADEIVPTICEFMHRKMSGTD